MSTLLSAEGLVGARGGIRLFGCAHAHDVHAAGLPDMRQQAKDKRVVINDQDGLGRRQRA